jgi:hypothetical protein
MEGDVAGFDQEHERGGSEQPEGCRDGVNVNDEGYGRLLMEVVVQIEAEADAYEDPEDSEPDERSAAIVTRRPGGGCMQVHPLCPPWQAENGEGWIAEMDLFSHFEAGEIVFGAADGDFCFP